MVHVVRENGNIRYIYRNPQDFETEEIDDEHEDVKSFYKKVDGNYSIPKITIWERMSDGEAVTGLQIINELAIRDQMMYSASNELSSSSILFDILKKKFIKAFGVKRTTQIFAQV